MKILIVEDEALVAMNMQDVLEAQGHQVIKIADDEESAILAAIHYKPDLALVDMRLSGGGCGLVVARQMHDIGVAVLFATGNCPGPDHGEIALGCLHKPLSDNQLIAGVLVANALQNRSADPPPIPAGMHLYR